MHQRTGWNTFGGAVWETDSDCGTEKSQVSELFETHGHAERFGGYNLYLNCGDFHWHLLQRIITFISTQEVFECSIPEIRTRTVATER